MLVALPESAIELPLFFSSLFFFFAILAIWPFIGDMDISYTFCGLLLIG